MNYEQELDSLMTSVLEEEGSDLHLSEGRIPSLRVSGLIIPLTNKKPFTRKDIEAFLDLILSDPAKEEFLNNKEVDFAYNFKDKARFRGNAYMQRGLIVIALRLIPKRIKTLEELSLPPVLDNFAKKTQGFFLVVGPTGQGKSTTLASLIELINNERLEHIITIEDPIEYIFEEKKSIIDQREVKMDTANFETALRSVFRQDVDVLMIGEMRSKETIKTAVTAAETGHLVFSTLHTNSASQTIDRIIDSFPADQQDQIRLQLAGSLAGIFSQRLIPRISGGLVPAFELLIANDAVFNLIRDKRTHEINTVIETGSREGMIDLNRSLVNLVRSGEITVENAFRYSNNPKTLEKIL
jgi:twitching motility protein PilT